METRRFLANIDQLEAMLSFILDDLDTVEVAVKTKHQIRLVCEEALINIINYAYEGREGNVSIAHELTPETGSFQILIEDEGVAFNPLEREDPDLDLAIEEREIGGLGIYMIKTIMDQVRYERVAGKNKLWLMKTIF